MAETAEPVDVRAEELRFAAAKASYAYFLHIEPLWSKRFLEQTREHVWDADHWAMQLFGPGNSHAASDTAGRERNVHLYRALALACHPDKCSEPWAADVFRKISEMYECGDDEALQDAARKLHESGSLAAVAAAAYPAVGTDGCPSLAHMERHVEACKRLLWYLWHDPQSILRQVLVTRDVLRARHDPASSVIDAASVQVPNESEGFPAWSSGHAFSRRSTC